MDIVKSMNGRFDGEWTHFTLSIAVIAAPPRSSATAYGSYFRFSASLRDIEEMMAKRGITVSYETGGKIDRGASVDCLAFLPSPGQQGRLGIAKEKPS